MYIWSISRADQEMYAFSHDTSSVDPASTGLLYLMDEDHIPNYCCFDAKGVDNIVSNARRKDCLLSDPLLSIGVFPRSNPDKIFQFVHPSQSVIS
jgi:hypothetical protein